ncbi:Agamous-like MADS-box protein AGL80 [Linum perenne]
MQGKLSALSTKKRQEELIQKTKELSILCGVDAVCVIYNSSEDKEPAAVWPKDPTKIIKKYREMSLVEQTANETQAESYLLSKIDKAEEELAAQQERIKKMEFKILMNKVHSGNGVNDLEIHELCTLEYLLAEKIEALRERGSKLDGGAKGKGVLNEGPSGEGSNGGQDQIGSEGDMVMKEAAGDSEEEVRDSTGSA